VLLSHDFFVGINRKEEEESDGGEVWSTSFEEENVDAQSCLASMSDPAGAMRSFAALTIAAAADPDHWSAT
jgi:hypothetical protein